MKSMTPGVEFNVFSCYTSCLWSSIGPFYHLSNQPNRIQPPELQNFLNRYVGGVHGGDLWWWWVMVLGWRIAEACWHKFVLRLRLVATICLQMFCARHCTVVEQAPKSSHSYRSMSPYILLVVWQILWHCGHWPIYSVNKLWIYGE